MAFDNSGSIARKIITEEMKSNRIDTAFVPEDRRIDPSNVEQVMRSSRYIRCKGLGRFGKHCSLKGKVCKKCWKSTRAWCTIDLKKQCIAYRWSKKCRQCKGESKPWFDKQALQRMAEYATKSYLLNHTGAKPAAHSPKKHHFLCDHQQIEGPPRYEVRCVQCRRLGRSCWKNSKHVYDDQEWLNPAPGSFDDIISDELSLTSEDEYMYEQYYCKDIMFEESDNDSPFYIYSDYEDTSESDYSYDPYAEYYGIYIGDGDLYNADGEPYDLSYNYPW